MQETAKFKKKSFTLAELLLATAILAFALSAILLSLVQCFLLNEANRNLTVALTHGQYLMEEIKNTNFDDIKNQDWNWDSSEISAKGLTALPSENITTNITGTDLLDVKVTVNWKDRGIRNRNTSLETLIAEP